MVFNMVFNLIAVIESYDNKYLVINNQDDLWVDNLESLRDEIEKFTEETSEETGYRKKDINVIVQEI